MNSFTYIISSFFPDIDVFKISQLTTNTNNFYINGDLVNYGFLYSLHLGSIKESYLTKFKILDRQVINHDFIKSEQQEQLSDAFCKAQRVYYGFCKLARLYKFKKAKKYSADTDLFMNPLSNLPKKIVISLYDDPTRTVYRFRLSDIITIVENSLSNTDNFFSDPLFPKNPYTNVEFTIAQLYTIYLKVKKSKYTMPQLFHMFYLHKFIIHDFAKYNECYIREISIKNFMKSGSEADKHYYIKQMLNTYNRCVRGLSIHPNFPAPKLINTFSTHLYHYLIELFSLNPDLRRSCQQKLVRQLTRFRRLNPTFGRRIYVTLWSQRQQLLDVSNNLDIPENITFDTNRRTSPNSIHFIDTVINTTPTIPNRVNRTRLMRHRHTQSTIEEVPINNEESYTIPTNIDNIDEIINSYMDDENINIINDESDVAIILSSGDNDEGNNNEDNNNEGENIGEITQQSLNQYLPDSSDNNDDDDDNDSTEV